MLKISHKILSNFISLTETPQEIADILTNCGLEVGKYYSTIKNYDTFEKLKIARVVECEKHPNADKLKILRVDAGSDERLKIVCGAPNIAKNQNVILATVGTTIRNLIDEEFTIKETKIRGELSQGMICSAYEIGLGEETSGIYVLPNHLIPGKSILDYFSEVSDYIYEIEVTANRGDACSHLGVARDLAAYLNRPLIYPEIEEFYTETFPLEICIENKDLCSKYCSAVISNIKMIESPDFFKEILKNCGIPPKSLIVDVLNYVMIELGQPMHAYDYNQINGKKISIKRAKKDEVLPALNGLAYKLSEDNLIIYDEYGPICAAGVIGGGKSAISESTTTILLESANFNPNLIRKSAKSLNIKTEASFRFERGVANIQNLAMYRVFYLIKQICPEANINSAKEHLFDTESLKPRKVEIDLKNFASICELQVPRDRILQILKGLEFNIIKESGDILEIEIPTAKSDVFREIDVIEEILRIYGLDKVSENKEIRYNCSTRKTKDYDNLMVKKQVSNWLTNDGYYEIRTNPIISSKKIIENNICLEESLVYLKNPVSYDLDVLRPSLIVSSAQVAVYNLNRQAKQVNLFEFGRIYLKRENDIIEKDVLSMFIVQKETEKRWNDAGKVYTLYTILYEVEKILHSMAIKNYDIQGLKNEKSLHLTVDQHVFAVISELPTQLKNNLDIVGEAFYAELDWNSILFYKNQNKIKYTPLPKLPKIERDISFYVDREISYKDIEKKLFEVGGNCLRKIFVIDIYSDLKAKEYKKSYTLRLEFQPSEDNISSEEVLKIMGRISLNLEESFSATIR